jgi:hypothetical protein
MRSSIINLEVWEEEKGGIEIGKKEKNFSFAIQQSFQKDFLSKLKIL